MVLKKLETLPMGEDKQIALKIFLTVFLISALFFKPDLTFARFELLTKAMAHYRTTSIEKIENQTGIKCIDSLAYKNHAYIEPTPGLSLFALTSYLPYSFFLQSKLIQAFSLNPALELKIAQFVMALSTVILFTSLLIMIFFLSLLSLGCTQKKAVIFSFLLYFGTPFIFYSSNLTNGQDILQAAMLFAAFFAIQKNKTQNIRIFFLSGLLCGLAVFVNVTSLFFLPLFFLIILSSKWRQDLFPWISGVFIGFIALLIYNQASFGNFVKISYIAKYGIPHSLHLWLSLKIAGELLAGPGGLLFFFPFTIMMLPMFKKIWAIQMNKIILSAVLTYLICLFIIEPYVNIPCGIIRAGANQGGGGPRHLLPIIPFLLYAIASLRLELEWKRILASSLIFISVIINAPGLFWKGGQPVFYNNFLLFCKNGFHSYMIDLIRDILISAGFNTAGLSIFPLFAVLVIFLWWLWIGERWIRGCL